MGEMFDLLILGGGPAGMTAGLYASRARLKTKLLERLAPGGQILTTHWVDNYPGFPEGVSGFELVDRMRRQSERFGLDIEAGEACSLFRDGDHLVVNLEGGGSLAAKTVIIATGAQPSKLGIPGEAEMTGRGVSYCATCDGPFYRNAEVAVVGGGDTAVEEALFLTRFASRIHLFHRRDEFRAAGILREKVLEEPKIEIHFSSVLTSILPDERGLVQRVRCKNLKTGAETEMPVEGVFMFVGQKPITSFLVGFVDLDHQGFVKTDGEMRTNQPGVLAAGDVRVKRLRQVSTAVGDGATAAYSAEKYLEEKSCGNV
ncbi:MAG: thioredoxin-disulfide reductase [Pseudomonadota bacterium]